MSKKTATGWLTYIFTIALAWLGLAGLSDAVVEWHSWFEQGIMQHWRSVKVWANAVLFDWLPFKLPDWLFDYAVLGAIFARALNAATPAHEISDKITKALFLPFFAFMWPIFLLVLVVSRIDSVARDTDSRKELKHADLVIWMFVTSLITFIPILFVCSTLLYEFG